MAGTYTRKINNLCKGLLLNYKRIIFCEQEQFYSKEQNRVITMFKLSERIWNPVTEKYEKIQLLKTASQLDVMLFLADTYKAMRQKEAEEKNYSSEDSI